MKRIIYLITFLLITDLLFNNCANIGSPSGGPKDTIPPTIIYSLPTNGTTNFKGNTFEFEFSEYINADKIKQQLIITPQTDLQYKTIIKRNKLIMKLDGVLDDTTTYNFNFANGVTDITEKNPVVNFSLAISTGPYIDSMSIQGSVEDLFTKEPGKGFVVGLYPYSDTLDFFADKPMYFTTANDSGNYQINYIKTGRYKVISFEDDNGNFLLDPETESHGFLEEIINLDSAIKLEPIRCLLQNVKPLTLINTRSVGRYVENKFNKQIDSYRLSTDIPSNVIGENNDVLRLYKPQSVNYGDSLSSILIASDSLGNSTNDTINYIFIESNRKPSGFSYTFDKKILSIQDNPSLKLNFNKPVYLIDSTRINITIDSTHQENARFEYDWNINNTELSLQLDLEKEYIDSLLQQIAIQDSINRDTLSNEPPIRREVKLLLDKAAFISVESDSSKNQSIDFKPLTLSPKGVLKVELNTQVESFKFQLLDKKQNIAYESINESTITFSSIKPDTYTIRILIDSNNDGKWSYGNLLKNEEPEEVFLYHESTSIRENWVVELTIDF